MLFIQQQYLATAVVLLNLMGLLKEHLPIFTGYQKLRMGRYGAMLPLSSFWLQLKKFPLLFIEATWPYLFQYDLICPGEIFLGSLLRLLCLSLSLNVMGV